MAPAKADLDALTRQALEGLKPLLQKRGIRVEHDSSSQIPLYCDSGWMRAAISNVIKNSAEAMEPAEGSRSATGTGTAGNSWRSGTRAAGLRQGRQSICLNGFIRERAGKEAPAWG